MKRHNINNFIKAPEVRAVDENGVNLGVFPIAEALRMAREKGLDLVEITANSNPPIAKICDFGKLLYREKKEEQKQRIKQKKDDLKRVKLTFKMGQHDLDFRKKKAIEFLDDGLKVQVEIFLRGREKTQKPLAKQKLEAFISGLGEDYKISGEIKQGPNNFSTVVVK